MQRQDEVWNELCARNKKEDENCSGSTVSREPSQEDRRAKAEGEIGRDSDQVKLTRKARSIATPRPGHTLLLYLRGVSARRIGVRG